MKILVLGSGGMAGHVVSTYLEEKKHKITRLSRQELDLTDFLKLNNYIKNHNFDVVINCVGLLVRDCDEKNDLAIYLNSFLPKFLEAKYKDTPTKLIHISSDGVFSGDNRPYTEESKPDSESWYGKTKALGEINNNKDLTFRMSIIGPDSRPEGKSLINWFLSQSGEVTGFSKVMWNGITTIELARAIDEAIKQELSGIYNLVPNESISKYELLKLMKDAFGLQKIKLKQSSDKTHDASIENTRKDFSYKIPDYKKMIADMKSWVDKHSEVYAHYEIKR